MIIHVTVSSKDEKKHMSASDLFLRMKSKQTTTTMPTMHTQAQADANGIKITAVSDMSSGVFF